MRPAAFESRDNTLEQIQKEMIKNIEKVIKWQRLIMTSLLA
jgi:hypothetical protein